MASLKRDRRGHELQVHEDRRSDGSDRRQSHRLLVDLEVDYQCEDTFLFAYITDMSAFGIFVRTNNPEPPGTRLNLRFRPPAHEDTLELEGEVIWINPFRPGDYNNLNPGMGIKFVDQRPEIARRLMELIRRVAYLEADEADEAPPAEETPEGEGTDPSTADTSTSKDPEPR